MILLYIYNIVPLHRKMLPAATDAAVDDAVEVRRQKRHPTMNEQGCLRYYYRDDCEEEASNDEERVYVEVVSGVFHFHQVESVAGEIDVHWEEAVRHLRLG